ncbi:hypothetical protein [Gordonia sputi]|uniref:Uncharacterized protein n=1 Tax=Gordonia sputi NBRC 100414 TaxID=1089453 RepID=H5TWL0_9ACTN|nr:hypothetical protein [Gordonia sputi]NKY93565.1 hypothetical protein [Gordonia sputi]GAB37868.1 hypothetical protein GOSPT_022_02140 [Gordonia sputi NBRC 100414]
MPPFADDELDEFYRRIEAGTQQPSRKRSSPTQSSRTSRTPACPTPEKDAYRDVHEVDAAVSRIRAAGRTAPVLRSYECICGSWHLTSRAVDIPDTRRKRKRS